MSGIKFGTDGWRAVTDKDFNAENVQTVIKAIGKYVFDTFGDGKKILVGYDPRYKAEEFALTAANQLSGYGFDVYLSDSVIPTPVLAYGAKVHNACAVMFTASHNPPNYLGIKFIPDYAGPATSDITDEIVLNLHLPFKETAKGSVVRFDFKKEYYSHVEKIIDFARIRTFNKNIIFDGLYSASIGYFDGILDKNGIKYDSLHMEHDINFGGGMPEPKPKFLTALIEKVKSADNAVGFANDGDADRFGVINENGEYVAPNEIIGILLIHLYKNKGYRGRLIKTVAASLLLDKIAEKLGVEVIETPVGFKHVGEAMRLYNPIIGGEESGGLSIQGHIPEKDGILANLLVSEAMAYENKTLIQLQEDLYNFAGCRFYNDRIDFPCDDFDSVKTKIEHCKTLTNVAEHKVTKIDTKDGVKLYLDDLSSWILVRPSGTEPLLRIYFESDCIDKIEKFKKIFC